MSQPQPKGTPQLVTFESELQFMAGNSAQWDGCETGGDLFGGRTLGGRIMIWLATPPGPDALHEATHFAQDFEYFQRTQSILTGQLGLQYLGDWHSHHTLGLYCPSVGDVNRIQSVASRNHLPLMAEIIATHEGEALRECHISAGELAQEGTPDTHRDRQGRRGRRPCVTDLGVRCNQAAVLGVQLHAFQYDNPCSGGYQPACIRAIRGMSPMRQMLLHSDLLRSEESSPYGVDFPMAQVTFNAVETPDDVQSEDTQVPVELAEQCRELPVQIRDALRFVIEGGLVVLSACLHNGLRITVAYGTYPSFVPRVVQVSGESGKELRDVTQELALDLGSTRLLDIFRCVVRRLAAQGSPSCGQELWHNDTGRVASGSNDDPHEYVTTGA